MSSIKEIQAINKFFDRLISSKNQYIIMLATQGNWHAAVNRDVAAKLQRLGIKKDLSKLGKVCFAAIINCEKLDFECVHSNKKGISVTKTYSDTEINIACKYKSAKLPTGEYSALGICVNGKLVTDYRDGLSVVVYDPHIGELVDAVTFGISKKTAAFRIDENCTNLLSQLTELNVGFGYTVAQWLHDYDCNKISVIVEPHYKELVKSVMLPIKMNDSVIVDKYFSNLLQKSKMKYDYSRFFLTEKYKPIEIKKLGAGDMVLYVSPFTNIVLERKIRKSGATLLTIEEVIQRAYAYIRLDEMVLKLVSENPGVSAFSFCHPKSRQDDSTETRYFRDNNVGRTEVINAIKQGERSTSKNVSSYIKQDKFTDEDWLEMMASYESFNDENGYRVFKDKIGKCINIQNGHRVTACQPQKYDNTIYVFGGCKTFGVFCADDQTLPSQLQKLLNETASDKVYRVENYGHFLFNHYIDLSRVISSVKPKSGDIIMYSEEVGGAPIFPEIDFRQIELPKNKGILFLDKSHNSPILNKFIAGKIFDFIKDNKFFRYQKIDMKHKTRQIPLCGMQRTQDNKNGVLADYEKQLQEYKASLRQIAEKNTGKIGSIVMNCNPFTLGHRYLIEWASSQVKHLYIFAVEEDRSIFPFTARFELMKAGTADLRNVTVLPSGQFIISSITFSEYFQKSDIQDRAIDPTMDVTIFAKEIAPALGITVRFAGEEPLDKVTKQYNDTMRHVLPDYGIEFVEIKRKESSEEVISASRVRKLLATNDFEAIKNLVPETTLAYLKKKFGTKHSAENLIKGSK